MPAPRLLVLDIETSPNIAATFQLRHVTIPVKHVLEPSCVFAFAAQWSGEPDSQVFYRGDTPARRKRMLKAAHRLLDQADAVVHYNGSRFDVPKLRGEFAAAKLGPYAPFRQVDLWNTAKRFGYVSSKLDHVLDRLNLDRKQTNEGMALWLACLGYAEYGDREAAWAEMEAYNRQDVAVTDELLEEIRPWVKGLPNPALYTDEDEIPRFVCEACGGTKFWRRKYYYTDLGRYPQYQCRGTLKDGRLCGRYLRVKRNAGMADLRGVAS